MNTCERRTRFELIKKTIKEAQNYLLVGVDVAKENCDGCFIISSGRMLNKHFRFANTKEGYTQFLTKLKGYQQVIKPGQTVIGIETTGNYMTPLVHYLEGHNIFTVMVSSFVTKRNRDTLDLSWNKNDIKDAWNIVDCMKQGKIIYNPYPNKPYGDMKRLITIYNRLSNERGRYKIRLQNNVLCIVFPEFTSVFDEVDEAVPMAILEHYSLPKNIRKVSEQDFIDDIIKRIDPTIKKSKLSRIYQLAWETIGSDLESTSLQWEIKFIIRRIREIRNTQAEIMEQIKILAKDCSEYELLQTIPGVGPVIAAIFMTEIGDINNFRSARQILKLAGLDLARIQSGQFSGETHISKRGRASLRSAAFQAALVAARNDTNLRMKYLDIIQKKEISKGDRRKAVIALACKILRITYAVMKNKKPYDDSYHALEKEEDKLPVMV
jgi:transposase